MSNRRALHRGFPLVALIVGAIGTALLVGTTQTGCGGGNGTGAAGSGGSAAGSSGSTGMAGGAAGMGGDAAGMGGGAAGTGGGVAGAGAAGSGGTGVACRNDGIEVTADITQNTEWACNSYVLRKVVYIDGGASVATLKIAAGSTIYGDANGAVAALVSTRNGRLEAVGTPAAPITFTSAALVGDRKPGDTFGGVVMLGKGILNNGSCINDPNTGTPACEAPGFFQKNIEGIDPTDPKGQYGGADNAWNCGELRYVRIQFGGYIIGANNELNGLTLGACGSATKLSYIQVHRGLDDGIEFFGGSANADHIVVSGVDDDSIDWDFGYSGKIQFLIVHQAYGTGDKGFESDNFAMTQTATPRSNPEIWNATMIGETGNAKTAMHLRAGTWYKLRNFIVYGFGSTTPVGTPAILGSGAVNVDSSMMENDPNADWPTNISIENSVFFGGPLAPTEEPAAAGVCPAASANAPPNAPNNDFCFDEAAKLKESARMNTTEVDPMFPATIRNALISNPSYVPGNAAAVSNKGTPPAGFDTAATYAGAVAPGTTAGSAWYDGWTAFPEN
jgi:hypothetical protein